jgi:hypothetical protein
MNVEVWGCEEDFWLGLDNDVWISRDVLEQLLQDRMILRKLLELQKKAHEKRLAEVKAYLKALEKEKEKYDYDVDKYPPELVEKLKVAEELDKDIAWTEEQVGRINVVLEVLKEVRA